MQAKIGSVEPHDALRSNVLCLRARLRLSQIALAERASISRPVISEIENGRSNVTLEILERIAVALETSVVDLLTHRVMPDSSDADIVRRGDGQKAYVDVNALLAAHDNQAARKPQRYSKRGRKAAI